MDHKALLADIEAFIETHQLSHQKFGVMAAKDWKLVNDLRGVNRAKPRRLWPETERAIRQFMATYKPEATGQASRTPQAQAAAA